MKPRIKKVEDVWRLRWIEELPGWYVGERPQARELIFDYFWDAVAFLRQRYRSGKVVLSSPHSNL
jgi:hypothetical protein